MKTELIRSARRIMTVNCERERGRDGTARHGSTYVPEPEGGGGGWAFLPLAEPDSVLPDSAMFRCAAVQVRQQRQRQQLTRPVAGFALDVQVLARAVLFYRARLARAGTHDTPRVSVLFLLRWEKERTIRGRSSCRPSTGAREALRRKQTTRSSRPVRGLRVRTRARAGRACPAGSKWSYQTRAARRLPDLP